MGDRISIGFKNGNEESIVLFSHWDGKGLLDGVQDYLAVLKPLAGGTPLSRREPNTIMLDFIRWYLRKEELHLDGNYYLGKDQNDGDNSDNGHFVINLQTEKIE